MNEVTSPEIQLNTTEEARAKIAELLAEKELVDAAVRVEILDPLGSRYTLRFVSLQDEAEGNVVVHSGPIAFVLPPESAKRADGATLAFVDDLNGSGFRLDIPESNFADVDPLLRKLQTLIDDEVAPGLAQHGGHVTLVNVEAGRAFLKFGGGCQGCGSADMTMKQGIEALIKREIPEILEVVDTTDHAAGSNPYYSAEG